MIRDVSIPMGPAVPEWPGDVPFSCGWTWRIASGASVNVSAITTSPHVGTHADAPLHVRDGWPASDMLPIDAFIGPAVVCSVRPDAVLITPDDLRTLPARDAIPRLLLHTECSIAAGRFPDAWPVLASAAVEMLLERGVRLVGVDAPSVDARQSTTLEVHHRLFEAGANVLENLDLRAVPDGAYELIALPLRVQGIDAAPVRAVVRELGTA
ncbi:MAG TPA: cyclase family protein [Gemmatimonadaceae bacterium]|nr:cyclase family protein [Gemmatimonadaceae bacterium]